MTPEEALKEACIERFGRRDDLLLFVNRTGRAKYTRKDGSVSSIPYGLTRQHSSDLVIGKSFIITPEMVGYRILQFGVGELKVPDHNTKPERLKGQINFYQAVRSKGGFGGIATTPDELEGIICQPLNLTT